MIRNIIFDWSGTLVDDLPAVLATTNHVFRLAGLGEITLETFRAEFCLPFKKFYDRYIPHVPVTQLEEWFRSYFHTVQDNVAVLPHSRDFLELCREREIKTFILSTVHPDHFSIQVKNTGLASYIGKAYTGVWDKTARIHEIIEENQLGSDDTLFIGDMQHDIETAHHGGILSCAVLTGYNSLAQLRESKPHLIVEHLGELEKLLKKNNWRLDREENQTAAAEKYPITTVGAAVFNQRGEVLMIRTHKWSNLWGIPGGKIKFGERAEDALRREIKEETDLEIDRIEFELAQDCIHSPEFYRDAHFVLLNYSCAAISAGPVRLNNEAQEYKWLPLVEAMKLPLNTPTRVLLEALIALSERISCIIPARS
jgi:phosphoglycolate phosphatase